MELDYRRRIYAHYGTKFQDATEYFDARSSARWGRSYRQYLRDWLPRDHKSEIVELACGSGRLLHFLKIAGYQSVTGVDISADQISRAKQVVETVIESDALLFLEPITERFDLVIALDLIEHFSKSEVMMFLDQCFKAIKPGGRIILQTPNAESPWSPIVRYGDFTHEVCFTPTVLAHLLRLTGFSSVEIRETGPILFGSGMTSSLRALLWAAIRIGLNIWNLIETGGKGTGIYTRVFLISGTKPWSGQ